MWRRWNSDLEFGWPVHADLNFLWLYIVFIATKLGFIEGGINIEDHCFWRTGELFTRKAREDHANILFIIYGSSSGIRSQVSSKFK
jgi:hypothetical protein